MSKDTIPEGLIKEIIFDRTLDKALQNKEFRDMIKQLLGREFTKAIDEEWDKMSEQEKKDLSLKLLAKDQRCSHCGK